MCLTLCEPMTVAARLLCPWDFPGKNTGTGCHFLLQGMFETQGSNKHLLCLLHWQADSLLLCHLENPSQNTAVRNSQNTANKDTGNIDHSHIASGKVKQYSCHGKQFGSFFKKKKTKHVTIISSSNCNLAIYPREMKIMTTEKPVHGCSQ